MAATPHGEEAASRAARSGAAFVAAWSGVPDDLSERLSASQLRVLVAVERAGEATASQLALSLDALPSSVTRLCDRLVAAGHIERSRGEEDRRVQVVRLTAAGAALLDRLERHRRTALQRAMRDMSEADREALLHGLAAFSAASADGDATRR
ncbi:MarR family winged helix-turn-helix transcriptional regulator [Aquipuribacter nitratireducens]|uniref:MarR family winged helix-turn-helix transcriptional regulator n=1 Tax=Aquipuribacter nitratireducens TaxID=650104 RepID=A0ABW0GSG0_9MICO